MCVHKCVCACACVCAHVSVCVCVCDDYGVRAIYITIKCMHIYVLCENSDSVRNKNPKSLQVVQAQCVSVCVCARAQVCTFMHMYYL